MNEKKTYEKVWAKQNVMLKSHDKYGVIEGKSYDLYSKFESDEFNSGVCYVILAENNELVEYDSNYFITELEYKVNQYNV